jgi:hypothetical protein
LEQALTDLEISRPFTLASMLGCCFQGSIPNADGLLMSQSEAEVLLQESPHEQEVLMPYLNDITDDPHMTAKKWCIFYRNMTETQAREYPLSYRRCYELVRPVKLAKGGASAKYWWRFYRYSPDLYAAVAKLQLAFVLTLVAKYMCLTAVSARQVFSNKLGVFAEDSWAFFSVIQSTIHESWARQFSTTLETRLSYTLTDCFETFPMPSECRQDSGVCQVGLSSIGVKYHELRRQIMTDRHEGLTKTYNRFHDPDETSADIQKLRQLHVEMDHAVAAAYGWTDLDLGHGFHETKQGVRFTISEAARREVLGRLLKLNHERHAEEVARGLHAKKKTRNTRNTRKKTDEGGGLFG